MFHVKTNLICLRHKIYWTELAFCCWPSPSESVCPAHYLLIPYFFLQDDWWANQGNPLILNLFLRHSNKESCRHINTFFQNRFFFFSVWDNNEQWLQYFHSIKKAPKCAYITRGAVILQKWKAGDQTPQNISIHFMIWVPKKHNKIYYFSTQQSTSLTCTCYKIQWNTILYQVCLVMLSNNTWISNTWMWDLSSFLKPGSFLCKAACNSGGNTGRLYTAGQGWATESGACLIDLVQVQTLHCNRAQF